MYGDGADRYEAQSIAETAARSATDQLRHDLTYGDIGQLQRDVQSLERQLADQARAARDRDQELWDAIAEVRERAGMAT